MRARVVAPLVAAILGIAGGVTTALVGPDDGRDPVTGPTTGPTDGQTDPSDPAAPDPLGLRIPLTNLDCTGQSILIVGYGDGRPPLASAVANSSSQQLSYLESAESCQTVLGPEDKDRPKYVVYAGPYDDPRDPCETRMSGEEPGSFVARLREGNTQLVKCLCEIPGAEAVRLYPGMDVDAPAKLWIRGLQVMFAYDDPDGFPQEATGEYDEPTQARVIRFQDNAPGKATVPGVVDQVTWGILTDRLCRNYDY